MSCIIPGKLYLGGAMDAAYDDTFMETNKITHVLNCTIEVPIKYSTGVVVGVVGVRIPLQDDNPEDSDELLVNGAEVLKEWMNTPGAVILVHCFAGMSRSVSVIVTYLVIHKNYTVNGAVKYLRQHRSFIRPFHGFLTQIRRHETYKAKLFSCLTPRC